MTDKPVTLPGDELHPLTPKQRAFVDAYLETGNAAESYRRAYDTNGSPSSRNDALALLRHPGVTHALAARREATQASVDAAIVAARLAATASVDRLDRIADMEPNDPRRLPSITRANEAILSIADVMPRGPSVAVDARSLTVHNYERNPRLARFTDEELEELAKALRALPANSEAVEGAA